ncbi:hypothetical protein SAMN05421740_1153 [Parapedobacter koreensis]|uniref:Uncharacterized protein n=1 Tax=Parapedobacter koreensis TaxID=332977 RepID=A0A1H7UDW0_9SPHI|nr:hypothetical protein SAMN05421740_1153 [Parapedobacter koreensis]
MVLQDEILVNKFGQGLSSYKDQSNVEFFPDDMKLMAGIAGRFHVGNHPRATGLPLAFGSDGKAYLVEAVAEGGTHFRLIGELFDKRGQIPFERWVLLGQPFGLLVKKRYGGNVIAHPAALAPDGLSVCPAPPI